jgi:hypothetical protein
MADHWPAPRLAQDRSRAEAGHQHLTTRARAQVRASLL